MSRNLLSISRYSASSFKMQNSSLVVARVSNLPSDCYVLLGRIYEC